MTENASKVTIHMVASLDGFIAKKDGTVSWLQSMDTYEKGITLSDEDVEKFLKTIHCYVMGSHTFDLTQKLGWPYGDVPVVVLTHRKLKSDRENVEFYSGDLDILINKRLKPQYRNIWVVGGAMLVRDFIRLKLANEIVISLMPIILGDGTLFFDFVKKEQRLHLKDVKAYRDGMVELSYDIIKK